MDNSDIRQLIDDNKEIKESLRDIYRLIDDNKTLRKSLRDIYRLVDDNREIKKSFQALNTVARPPWCFPWLFILFAVLLIALILAPFFFKCDSDSSFVFSNPCQTEAVTNSGEGTDSNVLGTASGKTADETTKETKSIKANLGGNTNEKRKGLGSSFKMTWYKEGSQSSSFMYLQMALCFFSYFFAVFVTSLICYKLFKCSQRSWMLGKNGVIFSNLLNSSPKREEYQEQFLQEMMRIYFNKKDE